MGRSWKFVGCVWLGASLALAGAGGCASPHPSAVEAAAAYPPDFALTFFVDVDPAALPSSREDPLRRPAQHVVEPDRTLRVALGPGVTEQLYPAATATLRPADMTRLYKLAIEAGLLEPAGRKPTASQQAISTPSPHGGAGTGRPAVRYRITAIAGGRSTTTLTSPGRNPAAGDLLAELVRLRGSR